jgi:hypothetical protein
MLYNLDYRQIIVLNSVYMTNYVTIYSLNFSKLFYFSVSGLMVLTFEAPVLCFNIESLAKLSKWIDEHVRFWIRGFIYFW